MTRPDGKLVRDRIPEIMKAAGVTPAVRILSANEVLEALFDKLDEEANELRCSPATHRLEELADVLEVIRAIATRIGNSFNDLEHIADAKKRERGGFEVGYFLERRSP